MVASTISPTIVVPGPWSAADIRYQAEQIATQKLHNGGHNCVSCQTLIMPEGWDQAQDLLDGFRRDLSLANTRRPPVCHGRFRSQLEFGLHSPPPPRPGLPRTVSGVT